MALVVQTSDYYANAVLALSPTSYWRLNELYGTTAYDVGSAAADGVIGGPPSMGLVAGPAGGRWMYFSNTGSNVITIAAATASTTTFTIAAWAYGVDVTPADNFQILGNSSGAFPYGLYLYASGAQLLPIYYENGSGVQFGINLSIGPWYHLAVTVTAGVQMLYINGVAYTRTSAIDATSFTPTAISSATYPMWGGASDVAYWAGTALSANQVAALYAAASVPIKAGSLSIREAVNARGSMRVEIASATGSYRPSIMEEITVTESGTRLFCGYIDATSESGRGGNGVTPIVTRVTASSLLSVMDRRYVTEDIVAGNLKAALTVLATYLPTGFILHPSQANGPALDAISWDAVLFRTCVEQLAEMTGYVLMDAHDQTLRMNDPAGTAAPFNLAVGDGNVMGDVTVEPQQQDYANRVIVRAGTELVVEKTQTETGDGGTAAYVLDYPLVRHRGYITVNGSYELIGTGMTWDYTAATNTMTRTSNVGAGQSIVIVYDAQFPADFASDDATEQARYGIVERVKVAKDVFDADTAYAIGAGLLAEYVARPRRASYTTPQTGAIRPGQTQTITLPTRDLTGTWTLAEVETRDVGGFLLWRTITVTEGTAVSVVPWRKLYQDWSG